MTLPRALHLAATLALLGASALATGRLAVPEERPYDVAVLPTAGTLRWLFPSHPTLAANLYWLRTVQYIGEPRGNARGWERLYPLSELVTDLDPRHGYAYQVTSTILSAVDRVGESNRVLEKGIRNVPERYLLPYQRAFNAFYYEGDFAAAGRYAELAARAPGAPEHLRQNVLAYYVKGNRADLAERYLQDAFAAAKDDDSRKAIADQLAQARFERVAIVLDEAIARFEEARGRRPAAVGELVAGGFLERLPPDPAGGRWVIGPDGRARSTRHEKRIGRAAKLGELPHAPGIGAQPPIGSRP